MTKVLGNVIEMFVYAAVYMIIVLVSVKIIGAIFTTDFEKKIAEELIDVIVYVSETSRLACPSVNMDEMFKKKLGTNLADNISMEKDIKEDRSHLTSRPKISFWKTK